jgi:hypothetical protein
MDASLRPAAHRQSDVPAFPSPWDLKIFESPTQSLARTTFATGEKGSGYSASNSGQTRRVEGARACKAAHAHPHVISFLHRPFEPFFSCLCPPHKSAFSSDVSLSHNPSQTRVLVVRAVAITAYQVIKLYRPLATPLSIPYALETQNRPSPTAQAPKRSSTTPYHCRPIGNIVGQWRGTCSSNDGGSP